MEIICPKCDTVTSCNITVEFKNFGCPKCYSLIEYDGSGNWKIIDHFSERSTAITLALGDSGVLQGTEYTVTAILVKKLEHYPVYFREYTLTSASGDEAFLSEGDGHWIFLKECPSEFDIKGYTRSLTHNDVHMDLYGKEDVLVLYAEGFFNYKVPQARQREIEFINPPFIYTVERGPSGESAFFGHHVYGREVQKAFGRKLPSRSGVGLLQPFMFDVQYTTIIMCCVAILIVVSHLLIYNGRAEKTVLSENLLFENYYSKEFVSKPFTLTGGTGPLSLLVQSNVDNSWASATIALINEATGEEIYASKDVEFYHGYEGGENWSEGSRSEEFNICGVPPGTYHLTVSPQKAFDNHDTESMHVEAKWDTPGYRNVIITCLIMLGFVMLVIILKKQFEIKRWAESDYSPYAEE